MIAKRLAVFVASFGLVAALIAPFRVVHVFVANSGSGPGILGLWMVIPIALGAASIAAVRTESIGLVWSTIGAVWGFVILAAWSLGTFFAWEALALLVAGIIHLVGVGPRWKMLLLPLWLVVGASAPCLVFLAVDIIRQARSQPQMTVTHAPAVLFGSWLSGAGLTLIAACYVIATVWRGRGSRRRGITAGLIVLILALVLGASAFVQEAVRAL